MFKKMMNTRFKLLKNQRGLTLVELLAVIVILGVVAGIAVPAIGGIIHSSRVNADTQTEALLQETAVRYLTDTLPNGPTQSSVTVATLVTNNYLKVAPKKQSASVATTYSSIAVLYTAGSGWTATTVTPVAD